jgi:hypothetical protein
VTGVVGYIFTRLWIVTAALVVIGLVMAVNSWRRRLR